VKKRPPPIPALALSGGLRVYLYVTAAITGAAIMIVEILGAKMLSPYLGLSHFVWTAQIAVTLVALACGYYAGGRLVDRSPELGRLYWAILGAAVYLAVTVFICEPVAYWCLDFNLAFGSLLASGILFFIPLALLAMTGPFLVRVITSSISSVGGNVGRLTSIGTLGSLAGTILIGYFLLPLLPNSITMYVTALTLMVVCVGYLTINRRKASPALVLLLALGAGSGFKEHLGLKGHYKNVVEEFRGNSHFGQLQVVTVRDGSRRFLLNDNLIQNIYDPQRKQSPAHFTFVLAGLARAYTGDIHDVLCIGLGVGIVPADFARHGARVDVVEINPAVVKVAARFFDLQPGQIHLSIDDGRHFLNRCRKKYDVVVLDAFLGDSSPSHLMTREAFASISHVLRPGGTLVINALARLEPGRDFLAASLERTLKEVFPGVRLHSNGLDGAVFFVATDHADPEFAHPPDLAGVHPDARDGTEATIIRRVDVPPEHGSVLTDDYNPVEFYDARNREDRRRAMAKMAKDM
jgi:spermidine synthase